MKQELRAAGGNIGDTLYFTGQGWALRWRSSKAFFPSVSQRTASPTQGEASLCVTAEWE